MPAKSEAQRRFLNYHFGHQWAKEHHFDNRGKLPQYVDRSGSKKKPKKGKRKRG